MYTCNTDTRTPDYILQAVLKGLHRGEEDFGTKIRVLLCCIRGRSGISYELMSELFCKFVCSYVVCTRTTVNFNTFISLFTGFNALIRFIHTLYCTPDVTFHMFHVEWSWDILRMCEEYRDQGVVGIDIAGDEAMLLKTEGR